VTEKELQAAKARNPEWQEILDHKKSLVFVRIAWGLQSLDEPIEMYDVVRVCSPNCFELLHRGKTKSYIRRQFNSYV